MPNSFVCVSAAMRWSLVLSLFALSAACGDDTSAEGETDAVVADAVSDASLSDVLTDTATAEDILSGEPCEADADCEAGDSPCVQITCGASKTCESLDLAKGVTCSDDDACTAEDACDGEGGCEPGPATSCDDGNPCTADTCDKATGCVQTKTDGATCSDDDACTEGDSCSDGQCVSGTTKLCGDNNPCTDDSCDPKSGCVNSANSAGCDDGDACTSADACANGACAPGKAIDCDDSNVCTADSCDPKSGCVNAAAAGSCDDGDACTVGDSCGGGVCLPGQTTSCDDSNVCTDDSCDPKSGCVNSANSAGCDDGDACTSADACANGACAPGKAIDCDDSNVCTADSCDPSSGCVASPLAKGATCTDGNACTVGDGCDGAGQCASGAVNACDDGNACTTDSCDPVKGCVQDNNIKPCTDGDVCTTGDTCKGGKCLGGGSFNCDDGNPCTDDSCDKTKGCVKVNNTKPCDDNNSCTTGEQCGGGLCKASKPSLCDDGNLCTTESCHPVKGCQSTPNEAPCTDGDVCTVSDTCKAGSCVAGKQQSCDDGNVCTTDKCDAKGGCVSAPGKAKCSDDNACTKDDACVNGDCVATPTFSCDDGKTCTADSCDSLKGCQHKNIDVPCSDGDACTNGDACKSGACVGSGKAVCNDGNPCTTDTCDKAKGCVFTNNALPCDDGDACTTKDTCKGGKCALNAVVTCNDKNPCTTDTCDKVKGCVFTNNALSCDDGDACTTKDTCKGGKCALNALVTCDDKKLCTTDTCDKAKGCVFTNNALPCDDGDACTTKDTCKGGKCALNALVSCNDKNPCTTDTCDKVKGCVFTNNISKTCSSFGTKLSHEWPAKLVPKDGAGSDFFGYSVSISGDRMVVGAYGDDDKGDLSGSAYVYERQANGTWTQAAKLVAKDGAAADYFGRSVSISGGRVVVGAYGDDDKGSLSGSAYVYERQANGTWTEAAKLVAKDGAADDYFGRSVSISGGRVVVGAYQHYDKGTSSGSAYVYERQANGTWTQAAKLVAKDGAPYDYFGWSVSISGGRVVVGAYQDDDKGSYSGSAYVYERQANGTWTEAAKLVPKDGAGNDFFGWSVSISGGRVVVGAYQDDDKGSKSGSAYVYERQANGTWTEAAKLVPKDGAADDHFGRPVSISGGRVVGGAYGDDDKGSKSGSAYVYERQANGTWTQTAKLVAKDGAADDYFSFPVSISGGRVVAGAYGDDDKGSKSGSAYVFDADGFLCVAADTCSCKPGFSGKNCDVFDCAGTKCDDGNACTTDTCDKAKGCVFTNNALPCDDGDACTTKDTCKGGKCAQNALISCDDGDACTTNTCDKVKGCVYSSVNTDGTSCGSNSLGGKSFCQKGKCLAYQALKYIYFAGLNKAYQGNLGGIAGANAKCQQQANAEGRTEQWRAFLSSSKQDVVNLITGTDASTLQLFNIKGQKLYAKNWNDIFDKWDWMYKHPTPNFYTFSGTIIHNAFCFSANGWSGTLANGKRAKLNCKDWTSSSYKVDGTSTDFEPPDARIKHIKRPCYDLYAVMCVTVSGPLAP